MCTLELNDQDVAIELRQFRGNIISFLTLLNVAIAVIIANAFVKVYEYILKRKIAAGKISQAIVPSRALNKSNQLILIEFLALLLLLSASGVSIVALQSREFQSFVSTAESHLLSVDNDALMSEFAKTKELQMQLTNDEKRINALENIRTMNKPHK